jgi:arylformamidase
MNKKLYLDYDQAELDRQLNLRARWPEHPEDLARWAEESDALRRRVAGHLDLAFGASAGEALDLFVPPGVSSAPLLAFIHGGYWQGLDKSDFSYLAPAFLDAGIAFASLNYDLAPQVTIEETTWRRRSRSRRSCARSGPGWPGCSATGRNGESTRRASSWPGIRRAAT